MMGLAEFMLFMLAVICLFMLTIAVISLCNQFRRLRAELWQIAELFINSNEN